MSRATNAELDALHALVARITAEELEAARKEAKKSGEDRKPVPVALIKAAMQLLKDNSIDTPARSERFSDLASQLEALDLDEVAAERAGHA